MFLDLVSRFKPELVFLMETKVCKRKVEIVQQRLRYDGLFYMEGNNNRGGLALLWKGKNSVQLRIYSNNHIDIEITWEEVPTWRATCYYGFLERHR